eukprot:TRINITY_DN7592_c0_g1_i1.p1 TRINITY_DN7592_c0_g1~~TRINITY_DN7592_c0_g1_i1.p1  ORF type:complete len:784 (+),score=306.59 TRINITY_DN7592_c0_g1_i1:93-2354(+)
MKLPTQTTQTLPHQKLRMQLQPKIPLLAHQPKQHPQRQLKKEFILGIDLGTQKTVIAALSNLKSFPEIVLNNISSQKTPTAVSFREHERCFGEEAVSRVTTDMKSTVVQIKLLLGREEGAEELQKSLSLPFTLTQNENRKELQVRFAENESFTPEQIVAMLLSRYVKYAEKYLSQKKALSTPNISIRDCVITVPPTFTLRQKRSLLDAAAIAGLNVLELISDLTAASLVYGYELKKGLSDGQVHRVIFVDVGFHFFNIAAVDFSSGKLNVVKNSASEKLGSHHLDQLIHKHVVQEIQTKYKLDVSSSAKAMLKVSVAIEKAKHLLSTVPEAPIEIHALLNDVDVRIILSRNQMNQIGAAYFNEMKSTVAAFLAENAIDLKGVESVQLTGGGIRVPEVQRVLQEGFLGVEVGRHLDSTCCVALGAALLGGVKLADFPMSYEVTDPSSLLSIDQKDFPPGLSEDFISQAQKKEEQMRVIDELNFAISSKKNDIETLAYDWRRKADESKFSEFLTNEEKEKLRKYLQVAALDWMMEVEREENSQGLLKKLEDKLEEVKQELEKIAPRLHQHLKELKEQSEKEAAEAVAHAANAPQKEKVPKTDKQKIEVAQKKKLQGNQVFKEYDYAEAAGYYAQALSYIEDLYKPTEEQQKEVRELKISLLLNISACFLKLNKFARAIENCKKVIELDPTNIKALFRRAQANIKLKDLDAAMNDLKEANKLEPSNNDVVKELNSVKKLIQEEKEKEKKMYQKMFE